MGDDLLIRGHAARAAAFKQRRMEPTAMLVGAFQIHIRGPLQFRPFFQREGMGATGVKPHVENIAHLLIVSSFVVRREEAFSRTLSKPGISAFFNE